MCFDPITLIGAGLSMAGSVASAQAQSASYKAQAAYADRQAEMTAQKGNYDANQQARQNDRALAEMRGQYLSSGIALSGSATDVLQDSATQASLDEQSIRYGAQVESDNYRFQGALARSNAKSAMTGGYLGALASGVNTLSSNIRPTSGASSPQKTVISNPFIDRWDGLRRVS